MGTILTGKVSQKREEELCLNPLKNWRKVYHYSFQQGVVKNNSFTRWIKKYFSPIFPLREFQRRHICFVGSHSRYIYTASRLPPRTCTAAEI